MSLEDVVVDMLKKGYTYREISKATGAHFYTIAKIKRKYGIVKSSIVRVQDKGRGQYIVTIPYEIRKHLNLKPGDELIATVTEINGKKVLVYVRRDSVD